MSPEPFKLEVDHSGNEGNMSDTVSDCYHELRCGGSAMIQPRRSLIRHGP